MLPEDLLKFGLIPEFVGRLPMIGAVRSLDRDALIKRTAAFSAGAIAISSLWIIRNLIETGQPLGPRFEGGAVEDVDGLGGSVARAGGKGHEHER